jgi:Xaa-Pro aminopeptidase
LLVDLAREVASTTAPIGADCPIGNAAVFDAALIDARAPLTDEEIARYRTLGRDIATAIDSVCRTIEPGSTEIDVAAAATGAVARCGARAIVVLCGADERMARYRHPPPTSQRWTHGVMLVVCAERHGLVVALTRMVSAGPIAQGLRDRTRAAAGVFGALLNATTEGQTGRALYDIAARAYASAGFPGEERLHHQGGAIGYQARDWLAHPASDARVRERQAFAWNPSITGTKVEDTALLVDGRVEIITASANWPSHDVDVRGQVVKAPLVLERS